ncbi:uncharacterized protein si:dkeyp-121d4.3 isoform X1 [Syngnathus typhle]|uniref:uncharacterized protein si:dkeyp-121d4.3 isoform X1 n=2 Tax=Syngnathus typhle TaxID=161592 RepID=UPI002A6B7D46|nr:uncharacterized protein si:dkeyp-121d4.3 isoform X1 [Syngnathus typhle]
MGRRRNPYQDGPPPPGCWASPREWGPSPPGGWGPPLHGGWGPPPPPGWGPPPPGGCRPPTPASCGPRPPGGWCPPGPPPPEGWGLPPPESWGPPGLPPPEGCGPPGLPPPEGWGSTPLGSWGPLPTGGWGLPPPGGWGPPPPDEWNTGRPPSPGWGHPIPPPHWEPDTPLPGWDPYGPMHTPCLPLLPDVGKAVPPQGCIPPFGFPGPPPQDSMPVQGAASNPLPEQPQWIKALISAPPTDGATAESKPVPDELAAVPETAVTSKTASADSALAAEAGGTAKVLGLLGNRSFDKPPAGRSTGIISFIGPTFGHIEREDMKKFTFDFGVFFGNPKAMKPGVRVHFTACILKNAQIATDVKVAPGGTENVDQDIYEGVVSQPIVEAQVSSVRPARRDEGGGLPFPSPSLVFPQAGERQLPGQVHVDIVPVRLNLPFDRKDSTVTLLKNDQVLINLLSDIVTEKRRATNIRPKIPETFQFTAETRETGTIVSVGDTEGVIKLNAHGELPFDLKENFSEVDFTAEDVDEQVEFTLHKLRAGQRAIRIQRVKEPLLLTLCSSTSKTALSAKVKLLPANMWLDPELYEGVVSQPIIKATAGKQGYPGQIFANIGPLHTNVTFDQRDCSVTLLKNDRVLLSLLVDTRTQKKRATNIRPKTPFTFVHTKEKRQLGVIKRLSGSEGILTCEEHGELPFNLCENFSDTEFDAQDVNKEVEFTLTQVEDEKRAIRLRRTKMVEDRIETEKRWQEEEDKKKEEKKSKDKKWKEAASVGLAAAKDKWTLLGFNVPIPDSQLEISKERFDGTVLKAARRQRMEKEIRDEQGTIAEEDVKIKQEQTDPKQEVDGQGKTQEEVGRLVMTMEGRQKQLPFGPGDLLTGATMLTGDKVRFNVAVNRETKEERATLVEILPATFEESTEQRRHGIVIEFSEEHGLIKCTQNPQLFFSLSEVIGKRKLQLNEKVEFSVVPHDNAAGGHQAIRIKHCAESVFLPARKLIAATVGKGKMSIKLANSSDDSKKEAPSSDRLKTVVKQLRAQDKWTASLDRGYSRSPSPSPPKDKFGRQMKRRLSTSLERKQKTSRHRRSASRERHYRRTRSRSRSASWERAGARRSKVSGEQDQGHKRRRERSPLPRARAGPVDDELARKKRELEELNDMIAFKKSLMAVRGPEPRQRTCIDYDHGRIANPLADFIPVRSILKKRQEEPEYPRRLPPTYDKLDFGQPYPHLAERYADGYTDSYADRYPSVFASPLYGERAYDSYGKGPFESPSSVGQRYMDRYDVYDEPYDDPYRDLTSAERPHHSHQPKCQAPEDCAPSSASVSCAPCQSPEDCAPLSASVSSAPLSASVSSAPSSAFVSSSLQTSFRPSSPTQPLSKSPSPACANTAKPPLDRFLDMLQKKENPEIRAEPVPVIDELLPHERALEDGKDFSWIVGLAQESSGTRVAVHDEKKSASVERTAQVPKTAPYRQIQTLLRTIGLKLTTEDMAQLASHASSPKREGTSTKWEGTLRHGGSSLQADTVPSPCPTRSSSSEPSSKKKGISEYEEFLDQQELEMLKRAQELQDLTKTMGSASSAPSPPAGPPPAHYRHPSPPVNWPLEISPKVPPAAMGRLPPGPPPGPPPRRLPGQPIFTVACRDAKPSVAPALWSSDPRPPGTATRGTSPLVTDTKDQSNISTTVAKCLQVIKSVKCLAATPAATPLKSVQFSLPSELPLAYGPAGSLKQVGVVKSKQKEKLDLYNQKLVDLQEQQSRDAQGHQKPGNGAMIASGKPVGLGPRNVWICGHSLVYWAESRAKSVGVGAQLGMDSDKVVLWWKGIQGLTWAELLPLLQQLKVSWPDPHVIIMHLDGNDLNTETPSDLLSSVRRDLVSVRTAFPYCVLVCSQILPRRAWRHLADAHEVDLVRSTVNRRIHNIIAEVGGMFLTHDNIRCGANTGLYQPDGVHLSHKGMDVFNGNLQNFLEKWTEEITATAASQ